MTTEMTIQMMATTMMTAMPTMMEMATMMVTTMGTTMAITEMTIQMMATTMMTAMPTMMEMATMMVTTMGTTMAITEMAMTTNIGHSDEPMTPEQIIAQFDTNNDSMISWDEFWYAWTLEDDHDDHDHIEPEKVFASPAGCPSDTVINVFHLEEGEYVVEFETEDEDINEFHLAALPMLGGHASPSSWAWIWSVEWAGIFSMNDNTHVWSMQQVGGAYADQTMRLVLIPTDTPTEATMHGLESSVKDLMEGDCPVVEDGETMTPIVTSGSCFRTTCRHRARLNIHNGYGRNNRSSNLCTTCTYRV